LLGVGRNANPSHLDLAVSPDPRHMGQASRPKANGSTS